MRLFALTLPLVFLTLASAGAQTLPSDPDWSNTAIGLRARFVPQAAPLKAGDTPSVSIEIQNASEAGVTYVCDTSCPARIHLPQFQIISWDTEEETFVTRGVPGHAARNLTQSEVASKFGTTSIPFRPDAPVDNFYYIEPGGSVTLSAAIPFLLPKAGKYIVTGSVPCEYHSNRTLVIPTRQNTLYLPELELDCGPGDAAAANAYDIYWGPIKDGLRAGLTVHTGFRATPLFGSQTWRLYLENTTDKPVTFTFTGGSGHEDMPLVVDAAGKDYPVTVGRVQVSALRSDSTTLAPHKMEYFADAGFEVIPPGARRFDMISPEVVLPAGDYAVKTEFHYKPAASAQWSGLLVTGLAPLKVVEGRDNRTLRDDLGWRDTTTPYGEPIEGVSCRIYFREFPYDTQILPNGPKSAPIPPLSIDIRNHGQRDFSAYHDQSMWQLSVDGLWYKWSGEVETKSAALPPGRMHEFVQLDLAAPAWRDAAGKPPRLSPGPHKVSVACTCPTADGGKDIRIVSNEFAATVKERGVSQ